jgi:hypothetical protein
MTGRAIRIPDAEFAGRRIMPRRDKVTVLVVVTTPPKVSFSSLARFVLPWIGKRSAQGSKSQGCGTEHLEKSQFHNSTVMSIKGSATLCGPGERVRPAPIDPAAGRDVFSSGHRSANNKSALKSGTIVSLRCASLTRVFPPEEPGAKIFRPAQEPSRQPTELLENVADQSRDLCTGSPDFPVWTEFAISFVRDTPLRFCRGLVYRVVDFAFLSNCRRSFFVSATKKDLSNSMARGDGSSSTL